MTISKQIGLRGPIRTDGKLGQAFGPDDLNQFSDEQLTQLFELYQETTKLPEEKTE
jgi:hypothetical protein